MIVNDERLDIFLLNQKEVSQEILLIFLFNLVLEVLGEMPEEINAFKSTGSLTFKKTKYFSCR